MIGLSHHRGFTHSAFGLFLFYMTMYLFTQKYGYAKEGIGFIIGYASHLIADFFTEHGIELLYPLDEKNYKAPLRFTTGGAIEYVICMGAIVFIAYKFISIYT